MGKALDTLIFTKMAGQWGESISLWPKTAKGKRLMKVLSILDVIDKQRLTGTKGYGACGYVFEISLNALALSHRKSSSKRTCRLSIAVIATVGKKPWVDVRCCYLNGHTAIPTELMDISESIFNLTTAGLALPTLTLEEAAMVTSAKAIRGSGPSANYLRIVQKFARNPVDSLRHLRSNERLTMGFNKAKDVEIWKWLDRTHNERANLRKQVVLH